MINPGNVIAGNLQRGCAAIVTDNLVRDPKCERVHRTGGRHSYVPVPEPARIILDSGLCAGLKHFDARAEVRQVSEKRGCHATCGESLFLEDLPEIREIGFDSSHLRFRQGRVHTSKRIGAIGASNEDLRDHRIVERADL